MWTTQYFDRPQADCRHPPSLNLPRPADPVPCVWRGVRLVSDSLRPVLCRVRAQFAYVNEPQKIFNADRYEVLHPTDQVDVNGWQMATDRELRALIATCHIVPARMPPPIPAKCAPVTRQVHGLYPRGAERREEEGIVTIEYSTSKASRVPEDLALLGSSGSRDLDREAVKLVRYQRVVEACPGERTRQVVRFELEDD